LYFLPQLKYYLLGWLCSATHKQVFFHPTLPTTLFCVYPFCHVLGHLIVKG